MNAFLLKRLLPAVLFLFLLLLLTIREQAWNSGCSKDKVTLTQQH